MVCKIDVYYISSPVLRCIYSAGVQHHSSETHPTSNFKNYSEAQSECTVTSKVTSNQDNFIYISFFVSEQNFLPTLPDPGQRAHPSRSSAAGEFPTNSSAAAPQQPLHQLDYLTLQRHLMSVCLGESHSSWSQHSNYWHYWNTHTIMHLHTNFLPAFVTAIISSYIS